MAVTPNIDPQVAPNTCNILAIRANRSFCIALHRIAFKRTSSPITCLRNIYEQKQVYADLPTSTKPPINSSIIYPALVSADVSGVWSE